MSKPKPNQHIVIAPRSIGDPYAPKPMTEEEVQDKIQAWLDNPTNKVRRSPGRTWSRYNFLYPKHNTYVFSSSGAGWTDQHLGEEHMNWHNTTQQEHTNKP